MLNSVLNFIESIGEFVLVLQRPAVILFGRVSQTRQQISILITGKTETAAGLPVKDQFVLVLVDPLRFLDDVKHVALLKSPVNGGQAA